MSEAHLAIAPATDANGVTLSEFSVGSTRPVFKDYQCINTAAQATMPSPASRPTA